MLLKPEIGSGLMVHLTRVKTIRHPSLVISIGNRMKASAIKNLHCEGYFYILSKLY